MLVAAAGSGKTTTATRSLLYIPNAEQLAIIFLAFNKNIVTELEPRVPSWCSVKTFHALGYAAWQRFTGKRFKPEGEKTFQLLKERLSRRDFDLYGTSVRKLVGFAKNAGMATSLLEDTYPNWYGLVAHNNLVLPSEDADEQRLVELSQETLRQSNDEGRDCIDFDDMLYLPLLHNVSFDKKNFIFIDEAQDTNGVQRALLHRMLAAPPHGRLIAVGDPSQAIYGFRGADAEAMQKLKEEKCMKLHKDK